MGRKTKTQMFLENENLELEKTWVSNWGLTRFWTLSERQGTKKWEF